MPKTRDTLAAEKGLDRFGPDGHTESPDTEPIGAEHPGADLLVRTFAGLRARLGEGRLKTLDRHLRKPAGYLSGQLENASAVSVKDLFAAVRFLGLTPGELCELSFRPHPVPPPAADELLRFRPRWLRKKRGVLLKQINL